MQWQSLIPKSTETKLLFSLMAFLIALRFILGIIYPVFSDACQYLYIAKHPSLLIDPHFNYYPPLLMLVGAVVYPIFGEFGLKLIAPSFGAIGIFYTYKIGKELFNEKRGFIAAVILGIIPSHIYLSAMPYQDVVVCSTLTVFIYYFFKSMTSGYSEIKTGILAGLTSLSKLTGIIVFPIIALYCLLNLKSGSSKKILKKCIIIAFIGLLISSPYYIRTYYLFGMLYGFQISDPRMESSQLTTNFDEPYFNSEATQRFAVYRNSTIFDYAKEAYLDLWGIPFGVKVSGIPEIAIQGFVLITIFTTIFLVYGIIMSFKNKRENMIFLHVWLLAWIVSILVMREQLMWGFRRLLPMTPPIALLSACGFDTKTIKFRKFFYLILILFVVIFPITQIAKALYAYEYFGEYSDALKYVKTLPENSVILIHDVEQCLYYSDKKCYQISQLKPEYLNITTLKSYNITYVVRYENYIFYDLEKHIKRIDEMAENGELKLVWQSKYVKIFEIIN